MNFYWINNMNMIEFDGPFPTEAAAKSAAETTFKAIQNGMALSLVIVESPKKNKPIYFESWENRSMRVNKLLKEKQVAEGHIRDGHWHDGDHPKIAQRM